MVQSKKPKLERLKHQLTDLHKKLIFAKTTDASNKIQLKIIDVKKKIVIAEQNNKSKLNSITPRVIQGGSPGLGKNK